MLNKIKILRNLKNYDEIIKKSKEFGLYCLEYSKDNILYIEIFINNFGSLVYLFDFEKQYKNYNEIIY